MTGPGSLIQLSKSDLIFFLGAAWCASREQIRSYFLEFCLSLRTRIFSFISTETARKSNLTTFVMEHLVGKVLVICSLFQVNDFYFSQVFLILVILQVLQISGFFFWKSVLQVIKRQYVIPSYYFKSLHCFLNAGHLAMTYHDGLSIFLSSYWQHILITLQFKSDYIEKLKI